MKKWIIFFISLFLFLLLGCQHTEVSHSSQSSGFPLGHDLNPLPNHMK